MRNYADRDNCLRDQHNSLHNTQVEFKNCFIIYAKYFQVLNLQDFGLCPGNISDSKHKFFAVTPRKVDNMHSWKQCIRHFLRNRGLYSDSFTVHTFTAKSDISGPLTCNSYPCWVHLYGGLFRNIWQFIIPEKILQLKQKRCKILEPLTNDPFFCAGFWPWCIHLSAMN